MVRTVPLPDTQPVSLRSKGSRSHSRILTERQSVIIFWVSIGRRVNYDRLICTKLHNEWLFEFFINNLLVLFFSNSLILSPFLARLIMYTLVIFHFLHLLFHCEVVIDGVFHGLLVKECKKMMHEGYQSVSAVHQARNTLVTQPHPLVLLVYEVLLFSCDTIRHTNNNAFVHVGTEQEGIEGWCCRNLNRVLLLENGLRWHQFHSNLILLLLLNVFIDVVNLNAYRFFGVSFLQIH